ncbi:hypothetical protein [Dyella choica]|uniref:Uncharacterized protein n=1 Tax=Dyella choica TaxID=1927959 RepID=A0A432M7L0_9GAMM|nr:hypothetical protein [Dyella choica]RUL77493.1 hypothetical protein EKH80_06270 [Dyella choica]
MICSDDTTRVHPTVTFWLINESHLPLEPEQAKRHANLMRIAGASLAMCVIRNLLRDHKTARQAKAAGRQADIDARQLSPSQVQGLRAALYFLRVHSDGQLHAERDE